MAHPPFERDEEQFLQSTGLDRNDLEPLVGGVKPLPASAQSRIAQRARLKIAQATTASPTEPPQRPRWSFTAPRRPRAWLASSALLVASVLALVILLPGLGGWKLAMAMEQALSTLHSYHAQIEVQWLHADGTPYSTEQSELWVDGDRYAWVGNEGRQAFYADKDTLWTVDHGSKQVGVRPNIEGRQIRDRLAVEERGRWVLNSPYKVIGPEPVAGRQATKLEISSPEGLSHQVWIDQETHLPLQVKEWWGSDRIRVVRYRSLEVNPAIDPNRLRFTPPTGYAVHESKVRWVASLAEAFQVAGLGPITPTRVPDRVAAGEGYVAMRYGNDVVELRKAASPSAFRWALALGKADGSPMGIAREGDALYWNRGDLQISISSVGQASALSTARLFATEITLPDPATELVARASHAEPVDPDQARALQELATRWGGPGIERQDPIEASYTFLVEKLGGSPVSHEPLGESVLTLTANTGNQAIVEVPAGPYARLYLKRLAPNTNGAWIVVGYDPR